MEEPLALQCHLVLVASQALGEFLFLLSAPCTRPISSFLIGVDLPLRTPRRQS